jgi:hypothetical protein
MDVPAFPELVNAEKQRPFCSVLGDMFGDPAALFYKKNHFLATKTAVCSRFPLPTDL